MIRIVANPVDNCNTRLGIPAAGKYRLIVITKWLCWNSSVATTETVKG
jgi:hypothetical protein